MSENIKIAMLEVENVKRVKAVKVECAGRALTVIGGRNGQGKTSVLDAIAFALGGARYQPSALKRDGALGDPAIRVVMDNGLVVERKGKNAALKVTDPQGGKSGQQLLNEFVSQLAIDLPKFLHASEAERAKILLEHLGIEAELEALAREEKRLYDERHALGRVVDQKRKYAAEMPVYEDVPEAPLSISGMIREQQEILARNGENQAKRQKLRMIEEKRGALEAEVERLRRRLEEKEGELAACLADVATAQRTAQDLADESTEALEANIRETDAINTKVRANLDRGKAEMEAEALKGEYDALTEQIEEVRAKRIALLDSVELPLEGLSIEDGKLAYKGKLWDCMSGSDQLRVGTAIATAINPKCGFVLLDRAEQFDRRTLAEFGDWLESTGMQAICTRVSTGDECSIVIEDGFVEGAARFLGEPEPEADVPRATPEPKWTAGQF